MSPTEPDHLPLSPLDPTARSLIALRGEPDSADGDTHSGSLESANNALSSLCQQMWDCERPLQPAAGPNPLPDFESPGNSPVSDISRESEAIQEFLLDADRSRELAEAVPQESPLLSEILKKLGNPADSGETGNPMAPAIHSLSDEDLLGMKMTGLTGYCQPGSACPNGAEMNPDHSGDAPAPVPFDCFRNGNWNTPPEAGGFREPDSIADGGSTRPDLQAIAAIHESASRGEGSPFSIDTPAMGGSESRDSGGDDFSMLPDSGSGSHDNASFDNHISVIGEDMEVEGQEELLRTAIHESNLTKLEALRTQLAKVFEIQKSGQTSTLDSSGASGSFPQGCSGADAETGHSLDRCSAFGRPVSPEFGGPAGETVILSKAPTERTAGGSFATGLSTAALFKDFQFEDDSPPPPAPAVAKASPQPAAAIQEEVADDVEDYMQKLLNRQRSGGPPSAPAQPAAAAADLPPKAGPEQLPVEESEAEEPPPLLTEEEFRPRSEASDKITNLDALRSLANSSTRTALDVFAQSQKKALYGTLLAAISLGIVGAAIFSVLAAALGPMFYLMSIACLGVVGWAGWKFLRDNVFDRSGSLLTAGSPPRPQDPAE